MEISKDEKFSKIKKSLKVFVDGRGYFRVAGRFGNYTDSFNRNYPLLLRNKGKFTNLLICEAHETVKYSGVSR